MTTPGVLVSINASGGGVPKLPRHRAAVTAGGVEGDRQRDLRYHGGPDRAVCLYSFDLIRALQDEGHQVSIGLLGENLTVMGLDWRRLTPGTRIQVGGVRLLITAFAVPCKNLSPYFAEGKIFRVSQKVHPGWSRAYARVEHPGMVQIGDPVSLVEDRGRAGGRRVRPADGAAQRHLAGRGSPGPSVSVLHAGRRAPVGARLRSAVSAPALG